MYDKLNRALCELVAWYLAESVSMVLVDYVEKELDNLSLGSEDKLKYKNIILDAAFTPYAEIEERELLEIYKIIDKNKLEPGGVKDNLEIMAMLEKHQQKYYWLNNNYYNAEELPVDYFVKRIAEFKPKDLDKLKKNRAEEVKTKKQAVLDKFKSEKLERISKAIDQYAYLHDYRKVWLLEYQAYLWKILDEFARRNGLSREEIRWYTMKELQKDIKPDPKDVEERKKLVVCIYYQGNKSVLVGKEAERWQQDVSKQDEQASGELKGMAACTGKVTGKVRVLHNVDELDKIQEGEILVASNTTPDYLPAMKKALAFLTEKGGITSHAAIVSREMNKPCIVGIVAITKKLKNGDQVEVDANQGIVKVLK